MNSRPVFLLDEGVARSVKILLEDLGYTVLTVQDLAATGSSDTHVARLALGNDAVLVAHDRDMSQIAKRNGIQGDRFKKLSLLKLDCNEPQAPARLRQVESLILHEWDWARNKVSRRLHMTVGTGVITTHR